MRVAQIAFGKQVTKHNHFVIGPRRRPTYGKRPRHRNLVADLKFLEQGGVPPATRSAGGETGFWNMLDDIGMAPATRSAMKLGDKGGPKGGVLIFPMETVPRQS